MKPQRPPIQYLMLDQSCGTIMAVGMILPFRDPADYRQVMRTIQRLWENGSVTYHVHAIRAMERCGLTAQDVETVVMGGSIVEHNKPREGWRWRIQGGCVDGHTASCVVGFEIEGNLLIITVIDEGTPERREE